MTACDHFQAAHGAVTGRHMYFKDGLSKVKRTALSLVAGIDKCGLKGVWPMLVCLFLLCLAGGCATSREAPSQPHQPGYPKPYKVWGKWYQPLPDADGFVQRGKASWYGKKFHGRKTANGEIYDMYAMTAAHKTLPFNTPVKVKNLSNGKSVVLRVNDRGPFVRGRIIDLSYAGAKEIGLVGPGVATVDVIALEATGERRGGMPPKSMDYDTGKFTFQVGAFRDFRNADNLKQQLAHRYKNAHIVPHEDALDTIYRVRVGKCDSLKEAMAFEKHLLQNGYPEVFLVAE
jgi:rare lipoprotein A